MAKPKEVNRYRSGTKNPHQEVLIYRGSRTVVYVVDYEKGKVETLRGQESEIPSPGPSEAAAP